MRTLQASDVFADDKMPPESSLADSATSDGEPPRPASAHHSAAVAAASAAAVATASFSSEKRVVGCCQYLASNSELLRLTRAFERYFYVIDG